MPSTSESTYSAFISYASEDEAQATQICDSLESRGFRCWIAPRDVRSGHEYGEEIIRGIEQSRCLVLVLSEAANESIFVRREVERAVSKRRPVFPIRVQEVLPSKALELFVSTTHWIDAWQGAMSDHVDRLVRDLEDESTLGEMAAISKRAARRRQMPKWLAAGAAALALVVVIVVANAISQGMFASSGPDGHGPDLGDSPDPSGVDAAAIRADDLTPTVGFIIDAGHESNITFRGTEAINQFLMTMMADYHFGDGNWKNAWSPWIQFGSDVNAKEHLRAGKPLTVRFNDGRPGHHDAIGPFTYQIDFEAGLLEAYKRRAKDRVKWISQDQLGHWKFDLLHDVFPAVKRVRLGVTRDKLDTAIDIDRPGDLYDQNAINKLASRYWGGRFLPPTFKVAPNLYAQLEYYDGTKSSIRHHQSTRAANSSAHGGVAIRNPAAMPEKWLTVQSETGMINFHGLYSVRESLDRILMGGKPDHLDITIDVVSVADGRKRSDPYVLPAHGGSRVGEVPIPFDTDVVYIQIVTKDGRKSEVRKFNVPRIEGVKLPVVGEPNADAPPFYVVRSSRGQMPIDLMPLPPPGTERVLIGFNQAPLRRVAMKSGSIYGAYLDSIPADTNSVRVVYQAADGSETGPFTHDFAPAVALIGRVAAETITPRRRECLHALRLPSNVDRDVQDAAGRSGLVGVREGGYTVVFSPRQFQQTLWQAVKHIRLGPAADDLTTVVHGGDPRAMLNPRTSHPNPWPVRLPLDIPAVFAEIEFLDGTKLGPFEVGVQDLRK